jgi:hypothetical protein
MGSVRVSVEEGSARILTLGTCLRNTKLDWIILYVWSGDGSGLVLVPLFSINNMIVHKRVRIFLVHNVRPWRHQAQGLYKYTAFFPQSLC